MPPLAARALAISALLGLFVAPWWVAILFITTRGCEPFGYAVACVMTLVLCAIVGRIALEELRT